jgi:hypothetical protein
MDRNHTLDLRYVARTRYSLYLYSLYAFLSEDPREEGRLLLFVWKDKSIPEELRDEPDGCKRVVIP